jgi:phenylacetate-CoA ligase
LQQLRATPDDVRTFDDYARLPLLTKDDLRNNAAELLSDDLQNVALTSKRTGGSTGVPVRLKWDEPARVTKQALRLRHDSWAHFFVGKRRAALWGDVRPLTAWKDRIFAGLFERNLFLDTLEMDEQRLLQFVRQIRRTRTRLLFGHGHSIYFFARFVKERGIRDLRFEGIISSAEMLPPEERRLVEEVFGDVVFDRYGCEEVGLIASECNERDGMHTAAEGVYVEILGGDEHDPGRVIVTDLLNRATPLLRYDIGDLATTRRGACRCGRGLPRIGNVTGRTSDILYSPDGKRVSGISLLDTVTIHIPGFRQVQIVQEQLDELSFNVVKDGNLPASSLELLSAAVSRYFGPSMRHKVSFVENIPLTGRGKFQLSICKLEGSDADRLERPLGASRERVE